MDRLLLRIVAQPSGCSSAQAQHSVDLHDAPRQLRAVDRPAVTEQTDSYRGPRFEETWVVHQRVAASVAFHRERNWCCLQIFCWTSTAQLAPRLLLPVGGDRILDLLQLRLTDRGADQSVASVRLGTVRRPRGRGRLCAASRHAGQENARSRSATAHNRKQHIAGVMRCRMTPAARLRAGVFCDASGVAQERRSRAVRPCGGTRRSRRPRAA
jgi:hypothetical protein